MAANINQDAVIIGGGFYGAAIAIYMAKQRGLKRVVLIERESALLTRASFSNQARVHNGYHYPRSFTTAYRSRINQPKFVRDWPDAIRRDFTKLYAIARRNSKVTAKQFERFCREIGAPIQPATSTLRALFDTRLIEDVFMVEEFAFDSTILASWAERELKENGVQIRLEARVSAILNGPNNTLQVVMQPDFCAEELISCRYVFNCSYSELNQFGGGFSGTRTGLKHEITEMALMQLPSPLQELGITVMDGH